MAKRLYLYPVWIRLWHILNALLFLALIVTGIALQFAGKGSSDPIIPFDKAVAWHNAAAVILMAFYVCFIIGNCYQLK